MFAAEYSGDWESLSLETVRVHSRDWSCVQFQLFRNRYIGSIEGLGQVQMQNFCSDFRTTCPTLKTIIIMFEGFLHFLRQFWVA